MPDIALPVVHVTVGAPAAVPSIPIPVPATAATAKTAWLVKACTLAGHITATLTRAWVTDIQWTLDAPTRATFTVPFDDPNLAELPLAAAFAPGPDPPFNREVKIYRNGVLIFWGPCVSRRANTATRVWQYVAYDPLWYMMHRNFGEANRRNYLQNGSFELPFPGSFGHWTAVGGGMTHTLDTVNYIEGLAGAGNSAKLSDGASEDAYLSQSFSMTSGPEGLALVLTGWVYIDSFVSQAKSSIPGATAAGMAIIREGAAPPGAYAVTTLIPGTAPVGKWVRQEIAVLMPPNVTETIEVRLHCPHGVVNWDAVTVTIEESLSFIGGTTDQTHIAQQIVRYAAGELPVGDPYNKSNLNIAVAGASSGIVKNRTYQFSAHQPIYQSLGGSGALDQFTEATDGFDFRIEVTELARTFRTYYPAVGRVWTALELTLTWIRTFDMSTDTNIGITAIDWPETIEGTANDVCVLGGFGSGFGNDAGREEGASSTSWLSVLGELTLELVESAPTEATLDLLNAIADYAAQQLATVIATPTLTVVEPRDPTTQEVTVPLVGILLPGDLVPVVIHEPGLVDLETYVRVTQVTYDATTETLQVPILLGLDRAGALLP